MNIEHNHLVIMAGGVGSRFWPMSTPAHPKQFIDILGCGRSLIQLTMDRFAGICPDKNVWVVTSAQYAETVRQQLPAIPPQNILCEPCRRNTAPCIAYVSWKIKAVDPKANVVVTPSDAVVMNVREFQRVVQGALNFTATSDAIVTLGMKPTRPETGYGYIEANLATASPKNKEIYRVDSFKEKPAIELAEQYICRNNFFWNAGIFVWNISTIINAFRIYQTPISAIFDAIAPHFFTPREQALIDERFPNCPNISVDYAIMENSDEIFIYPANFGWSDLGSWGSLYERLPHDLAQNVAIGENIALYDSSNCIVHATDAQKVVVQGLDGYIVALRDNVLLVCKMREEQRIKYFSGSEP